jgi:hypothetical protein
MKRRSRQSKIFKRVQDLAGPERFIQCVKTTGQLIRRGISRAIALIHLTARKIAETFRSIGSLMPSFQFGRIFRRMGLPFWTFLGVGLSGWWFDNAAALLQQLIRQWLGLGDPPVQWTDYIPALITFLIPVVVVLVIGFWQSSRRQLSKMRFISSELQQPQGKKGLILLVSNPNSAIYAIDYHYLQQKTLEKVWLIPSNAVEADKFGQTSQSAVAPIQQHCEVRSQQEGRPIAVEVRQAGVSPADAQDTFDYVNRVFRRSGYEPNDLIADFTGGTKPMSVGMIMACLPTLRELEYVSYNSATQQSHGPFLVDYQHSAFDLVG